MLKDLKIKFKTFVMGEPITDTYSMYCYKVVTISNEEYKCNMDYYTIFSFKDWVELYLLNKNSIPVTGDKLINRSAIKEIQLVKLMDRIEYTRRKAICSYKGTSLSLEEAEDLRDRNDW